MRTARFWLNHLGTSRGPRAGEIGNNGKSWMNGTWRFQGVSAYRGDGAAVIAEETVVEIAVWLDPVGGSTLDQLLTKGARARFWKARRFVVTQWASVY